ncbi:MAG TPA: ABC transporter ATP-binding protein [Anaerolineales bacterium]|nr:ABC transporter ATP-binding protein [Anaerolineales bacterium]
MPVLEAHEISKQYKLGQHKVNALDGVNFQVEKGEFVAIMGPSGSGKSTLLHLLGGLDSPSSGNITLAEQSLAKLSERKSTLVRRHNVGFVFQFFNLLPTLTAEENILLPVIIDGKNPRKYAERLKDLLTLVGLNDRRTHKPDQLSGGEQQRVAIARALITEPAILLADEPTGNLDTKTGTAIMELLRRSCDEFHQTVIVVTHDPKAAAYANRITFLRDGNIVEELHPRKGEALAERLRSIMSTMERLEA